MTDPEIVAAWEKIHDVTPPGWYVGRPGYNDTYRQWEQYACLRKIRAGAKVTIWPFGRCP